MLFHSTDKNSFPAARSATVSPDDRLEQALRELCDATAADLLDNLLRVSPNRFEVIVLDVLTGHPINSIHSASCFLDSKKPAQRI